MSIVSPLLTRDVALELAAASDGGATSVECSLDLRRSRERVLLPPATDAATRAFEWRGRRYPLPDTLRDRTVYAWNGESFEPVSRYAGALIKLVPTDWGPPTFEIDGIKMLPTARVSPLEDARRKVALVEPRGRRLLDTCGGLGYFAVAALEAGAAHVQSFEKNADVLWLRTINPWSPREEARLTLTHADVTARIGALPARSVDAVLHDPPRFGIAGELYSQAFYDELARVLVPRGRLFHYTGTPNRLTSGRDVPGEVLARLTRAGFDARRALDGVLAIRRSASRG